MINGLNQDGVLKASRQASLAHWRRVHPESEWEIPYSVHERFGRLGIWVSVQHNMRFLFPVFVGTELVALEDPVFGSYNQMPVLSPGVIRKIIRVWGHRPKLQTHWPP